MNKIPRLLYLLPLLFSSLLSTALGAMAICMLLKAEFIPGEQPYSYNDITNKLSINIKVRVQHKDRTTTSGSLKKTVPIDTSTANNWNDVIKLIDNKALEQMNIKAQELCEEKGCNK